MRSHTPYCLIPGLVLGVVLGLVLPASGAVAQFTFPEPVEQTEPQTPQPAQNETSAQSATPEIVLTPPPLPEATAAPETSPDTEAAADTATAVRPDDVNGIVENELCHAQFFDDGTPAQAVIHCTRALESGDLSEGDIVTALVNRGVAYKLNGQLALAIEDYTAALEKSPEAGDIYTTRANAFLEMSQLDAAISDANKALAFNPEYAAAYYVRGRIFEALGQNTFAGDDFMRAYELAPDNKDIEEKAWAYGSNQN
ncbi:tetratricopeptide repeat protein [Pyruvatibacter sp.]|uniref:tetratricopeptide repeat protein n=1 Tax=Pyruvatibacter sp. TaxID=1981328 RepID=UPI0032EB0D39